jgi:serine/threonine protein kinase
MGIGSSKPRPARDAHDLLDDIPSTVSAHEVKLAALLGAGSFARVYRAEVHGLDGLVAAKVMEKSKLLRGRACEHAWMERHALARLAHPSIVRLLHSSQDERAIYLVLEYVDGVELETFSGALTFGRAQHYAMLCVDVLEHLASLDITWRDCKPENVLCIHGGDQIKAVDFGTAKVPGIGFRVAECVGTPQYMSPEAVAGHPATDPRSDLWSFGCLLFRLLSGLHAFDASSEFLVMQAVRRRDMQSPPDGFPATALVR